MTSQLFDKRSEFFKSYFQKALPYRDFLKSGSPQHSERWQSFAEKINLTQRQNETAKGFISKLNILTLAGIWCGDCARQCPMLHIMSEASSVIELRLIDNQSYPELRDELRISGGSRVPVVVALSEDFFEMARFGDRQLSVYRKKAVNELGAACDPGILAPPEDELSLELNEWFEFIERVQLMLRLSPFLRDRYKD